MYPVKFLAGGERTCPQNTSGKNLGGHGPPRFSHRPPMGVLRQIIKLTKQFLNIV